MTHFYKTLLILLSYSLILVISFPLRSQSFQNERLLLRQPVFNGVWVKPVFMDIDSDNDQDLFFGNGAGELTLFHRIYSEATSSLTPYETTPTIYDQFEIGFYSAPAFADLDNDGDLDMISGNEAGGYKYWRNDGSNESHVFSELSGAANPIGQFDVGERSSPTFVDLDGDSDMDMVSGNSEGLFFFFLNTGTVTQPVFIQQHNTDNPFSNFTVQSHSSPAFADIDGDGDLDMISGDKAGAITFYKNIGTSTSPSFALQTDTNNPFDQLTFGSKLSGNDPSFPGNYSSPSFVDHDNDTDLDLVVGTSDGVVAYVENEGTLANPSYTPRSRLDNPFRGFDLEEDAAGFDRGFGEEADVELIDLDGDTDLDLVAFIDPFNNPIVFHYFENVGNASASEYSFAEGSASPFATISDQLDDSGLDTRFLEPSYADIDNDGDIDMICGEGGGRLAFFENRGSSQNPQFIYVTEFNPFSTIDIGQRSDPTFGDMDNDGDLDLVLKGNQGALAYFRNEGTPTAPSFLEIPVTNEEYPFEDINTLIGYEVSIADANADGWKDIIIGGLLIGGGTSAGGGDVGLWLNNRTPGTDHSFEQVTGVFPFSCGFAGCAVWDFGVGSDVGMGDLDGDGDDDMVIAQYSSYLLINFIRNTAPKAPVFFSTETAFEIVENSSEIIVDFDVRSESNEPTDESISYSVSGTDGSAFSINSIGELSFVTPPDFENPVDLNQDNLYEIEITADNGEPQNNLTTKEVIVHVTDQLEPSIVDQSFSINENQAINSSVGVIEAQHAVSFAIISGNELNGFTLNTETGELFVANSEPLDFETNPAFMLLVRVENEPLADEALITINLMDINESPSLDDQSFSLDENSPIGTLIGRLNATDPDSEALTYTIVSGNTQDAFALDANTGDLMVANTDALDFETNATFSLSIDVSDGEFSTTATITISLNDLDESVLNILESDGSIEIFPNPASEFVTIKAREPIKKVSLVDASGKLVQVHSNIKQDQPISLKALKTGVYFISIQTTDRLVVKRLLHNNKTN